MADRRTQSPREPSQDEARRDKPDRSAELIHELATEPPAKDIASVKAASDVFEALKKKVSRRRQPEKAH